MDILFICVFIIVSFIIYFHMYVIYLYFFLGGGLLEDYLFFLMTSGTCLYFWIYINRHQKRHLYPIIMVSSWLLFFLICILFCYMCIYDIYFIHFFVSVQTADSEALLKWTSDPSCPFRGEWEAVKLSKTIKPLQFHLLEPTVHSQKVPSYIGKCFVSLYCFT